MAGATHHQPNHVPVGYGDDTQSSEDTGNPRKNQTFPMCLIGQQSKDGAEGKGDDGRDNARGQRKSDREPEAPG